MNAAETSIEANENTFAYLAVAAQRKDNRLAPEPTEQLLRAANKHLQNNLTMPTLIQEGLIEYRTKDNRYSHLEPGPSQLKHFCIPIPSFGDHILSDCPDPGGERTVTVQKHLDQMDRVPAWEWRAENRITRFVSPPSQLSKKHVPGNVPRLVDAVPGDQLDSK